MASGTRVSGARRRGNQRGSRAVPAFSPCGTITSQFESKRSERSRALQERGWIVAESQGRVSAIRGRVARLAFAATAFYATLAGPAPARADTLALEVGGGNLRSHGEAFFLSWRKPAASLFGHLSYYESTLGAWLGPDANEAITLARGVQAALGRYRVAVSAGIGYVTTRTDNLGTHLQFVLRLTLARPLRDYELALAQRHYSNGRLLLDWPGPNRGENFLALELARRF